MKMYPQLATQGSEMNKRFVEEYHRREAAGQPVNAVELGRELFGAPLTPNTPGTYTVRGTTYGNVSPEQQAHYRENVNRVMNQQRQIDEDRATRLNPVNRYDEVRRNIERRYGIGPSQEARYERDLQQAKDNSAQLKYYHNQEAQAKQDSAEKQRVGGYLANHELSPEERAYYQRRVAEINQRNSGPMAPPPPTPIRY
jgi:hypothetical protein